jgi:hypothetical protein
VGPLTEVRWPTKFKACHNYQYDGSSNPEEFIQFYQTIIEADSGDDRVKANFLHTILSGVARSWLINLPKGSIHSWDQLCDMFIENIKGTYEHSSTAEILKTIKQKHDESLRDYLKHFCNARNGIPHIQDIEIINTFHDGVSDVKIVEEIAMKKPKMVADLLAAANICIEASEARARLMESRGKGPSRKRMIGRSTPWNEEIRETAEETGTVENNSQIKRRGDPSDTRMMQKSGARSTVPMGMI